MFIKSNRTYCWNGPNCYYLKQKRCHFYHSCESLQNKVLQIQPLYIKKLQCIKLKSQNSKASSVIPYNTFQAQISQLKIINTINLQKSLNPQQLKQIEQKNKSQVERKTQKIKGQKKQKRYQKYTIINQQFQKQSKNIEINLIIPLKKQIQIQKYEFRDCLGKGANSSVQLGFNKNTREKVAIKIYYKKDISSLNKIKNLQRQINLLAQMNHPTIPKLIQIIQTSNFVYLILEYAGKNSLYDYIKSKPYNRIEENEAKRFIFIIAEALKYIHDLGITHRDIKAENVLINRHMQIKLIDFGFSLRCPRNEYINTFCGTPVYMAPQVVSKIDHFPIYTDIWSLGVLYFVMLQGNYPFRAKNGNEISEKIKKGHFQYIYKDTSQKSKKFIESLLKVNPLERLTIKQVLSQQNRAWLNDANIK